MKLKRFNYTNSRFVHARGKSTIRFNKQGQITLSSILAEAMHIKVGSKIELLLDEDSKNPERPDWYISISDNGFELKTYKNNGTYLSFNSTKLTKKFIESLNKKGATSVGCIVSTEPIEIEGIKYWPIITSSAI